MNHPILSILAEARRNGIDIGRDAYNKNRQEIELPNESKIRGFSAEKPDSIRGQNLSYCWFDELAMIRYFAWNICEPGAHVRRTPPLISTAAAGALSLLTP